VIFESGSILSRIEKGALRGTGLISIEIPSSVEILGENCFIKCESLTSPTFESQSIMSRTGKHGFDLAGLTEIVIPPSVDIFGDGVAILVPSPDVVKSKTV
jgi:hypothetical protein